MCFWLYFYWDHTSTHRITYAGPQANQHVTLVQTCKTWKRLHLHTCFSCWGPETSNQHIWVWQSTLQRLKNLIHDTSNQHVWAWQKNNLIQARSRTKTPIENKWRTNLKRNQDQSGSVLLWPNGKDSGLQSNRCLWPWKGWVSIVVEVQVQVCLVQIWPKSAAGVSYSVPGGAQPWRV